MKRFIDKYIPAIIAQLGGRLNPIFLKFRNEQKQLLVFYFHGLYQSEVQKECHHVDPQNNLTLAEFAAFIKYFLLLDYQFIRAEDLLEQLPTDQPSIMITFDDGYFNNSLALEVLNQFKTPATFFITTKNVLENRSYWWDVVYKFRKKQGEKLEMIQREQECLKALKWTEIDAYIHKNFGAAAFEPWSDIDRPFSPSELQSFADNPLVCIGNHTENHAILTNCNEEEIQLEFTNSNTALESMIGKKPCSVAFPNGDYNELVLESTRKAGFRLAFSTEEKSNTLPLGKEALVNLNRFMARTEAIEQYGSFSRMGYTPDGWYTDLKKKIKGIATN